jgi:hypothetical protein
MPWSGDWLAGNKRAKAGQDQVRDQIKGTNMVPCHQKSKVHRGKTYGDAIKGAVVTGTGTERHGRKRTCNPATDMIWST